MLNPARTGAEAGANGRLRTVHRMGRIHVLWLSLALTALACGSGSQQSTSTSTQPPSGCSATSGGATSPSGKGDVSPPGDIPDDTAFVPFVPARGGYTFRAPEGWARTSGRSGDVSFTDKLNTIRVQLSPAPAAPTLHTAATTELSKIRAKATCFEGGKVSVVVRGGHPVIRITYRADAAPDPVTGKVVHDDIERFEYWSRGTEAALTLSGPAGSDNVDAWKLVSDSFRWM
jgi:hypothetical protein